ncbi:hypothetical protein HYV12_03575 [Candidatus Dojkabacteria bacterium]|nr:hypothetical protein [Candidatus Dojkabacteria bacterium]
MEPRIREPKKSSSLLYVFLFILLALIGYLAYSYVSKQDDAGKKENDTEQGTDTDTSNDEEELPVEEEETEDNTDTDTDTPVVTDLSNFKTTAQNVGVSDSTDTSQYTLSSLTNTANVGYHSFVFTLVEKSSGSPNPYVTSTYVSSLGAIRVDFKGVTTDNSGIGYQKSLMINKEGVVKVYHNVSADQTEELYDVGVTKETPFLLTSTSTTTGTWSIKLDVKYPGASDSDTTVDLGSDEFSKTVQSIVGATRTDGAKVSSYSYSSSGGVLRVVFEVKGSTEKPIPSATAGYDGDNNLVLRFTDIVSDAIAKMPAALTMSGGVTMIWEMDGTNASKYTFDGATKDFKLYGSTNPNQIIIEIKL